MSQDQFAHALLNAEAPVPDGIVQPDGTPASRRFDVYRNNVIMSLSGALADGYPVVQKLVGEAFFNAVAGVYVRAHPPKSPLMIFYGADFAEFLDDFEPAQQIPYLADVARLEWARRRAFHAADAVPAPLDPLSDMDEETLLSTCFALHPSHQIVSSSHPIYDIWDFNSNGGDGKIVPTAQSVLVARPTDQVQMHLLGAGEDQFLRQLDAGATLGQAAQVAATQTPAFDLSQCLARIFGAAILTDIKIENNQ
jgi:hypothetical protein